MNGNSIVNAAKIVIGSVVSFWLGLHAMIHILVYAITVDIATGLVAAWTEKKICSDVSRRGIGKKAMMLLAVGATELVSRDLHLTMTVPYGGEWSLGAVLAGYYAIHEAISATENISRIGVPLPKWLTDRLQALKQEAEK